MANLTKCLTSISPDLRSGLSPGRRLLAAVLCAMLVLGSALPGIAFAGEADSEGEGTAPPVEAPIAPDFDPGGEETALEGAPASGGEEEEEGGAVEVEPEVDIEVPLPDEVTSATTGSSIEESQSQPAEVPPVAAAAPEPEPVQPTVSEPAPEEPAAKQSPVAPKRGSTKRHVSHEQPAPTEAATAPTEPAEEEVPSSPPPQAAVATSEDPGRNLNLQGKDSYVVRPGDCLWNIATALLPAGADTVAIEAEVKRLWRLNEDRIGTGDPSLIYAGTTLRLR